MAANLDVSGHPAARRVLDTLSRSVASEASTVRLGPVLRRRDFGKVTVENAHCLDVTALVRELPRGSRVFVRDSEGDGRLARAGVLSAEHVPGGKGGLRAGRARGSFGRVRVRPLAPAVGPGFFRRGVSRRRPGVSRARNSLVFWQKFPLRPPGGVEKKSSKSAAFVDRDSPRSTRKGAASSPARTSTSVAGRWAGCTVTPSGSHSSLVRTCR